MLSRWCSTCSLARTRPAYGLERRPHEMHLIDADGAARLGPPYCIPAAARQVLIPIPQYPLYTATLALYNGCAVPYYLDEDGQWSLSVRLAPTPCWSQHGTTASRTTAFLLTGSWAVARAQANQLREAIKKARAKGTDVRALVVINPGNPTGQCLDEANTKEVRHGAGALCIQPAWGSGGVVASCIIAGAVARLWKFATASASCSWPTRSTR